MPSGFSLFGALRHPQAREQHHRSRDLERFTGHCKFRANPQDVFEIATLTACPLKLAVTLKPRRRAAYTKTMHVHGAPTGKMQRVLRFSLIATLAYVVLTFITGLRAHS